MSQADDNSVISRLRSFWQRVRDTAEFSNKERSVKEKLQGFTEQKNRLLASSGNVIRELRDRLKSSVTRQSDIKDTVSGENPVTSAINPEEPYMSKTEADEEQVADSNTGNDAEVSSQEITANPREDEARSIVKNHIIASMAVGLVPIPLFDLAALITTQMNMLRGLSDHYEVSFEEGRMKSLLTALAGGSLPVFGVLGLSSVIKLIPGIGTLGGSASVSLMAGAVTYAVGRTFTMHYEAGGTLEDFEPGKAREFFKEELERGKSFVAEMREEMTELKEDLSADKGEAGSEANKKA